jgi:hypothetical protein
MGANSGRERGRASQTFALATAAAYPRRMIRPACLPTERTALPVRSTVLAFALVTCLVVVSPACSDGSGVAAQRDAAVNNESTDADIPRQGDAGDDGAAAAGTLTFRLDGQAVSLPVRTECIGGHQNFGATDGTTSVFLSLFISSVGTYRCDEPMPFIILQYQGPVDPGTTPASVPADGAGDNFFISGGSGPGYAFNGSGGAGGGDCTFVVSERKPRFKATFSASLALAVGSGPATIAIDSGEIDVTAPDEGCL